MDFSLCLFSKRVTLPVLTKYIVWVSVKKFSYRNSLVSEVAYAKLFRIKNFLVPSIVPVS